MILGELLSWMAIGLLLALIQILATNEKRAGNLLTIGALAGMMGGALGRGFFDGVRSEGVSLSGIIAACAFSVGALVFYDLVHEEVHS